MSKRQDYQALMEDSLALWSARFAAIRATAGNGAKPEIASQLARWQAAEEQAAAKLAKLKASSGDQWDAIKVEVEKAWHAIESLLNEGEPRSRLLAAEEMQSLTSEQQDAILEAMVVAAVAGGNLAEDEIARFNVELAKVPWTHPKDEIVKKALAAHARVLALANDDERQAMLKGIAARLPPGPIVEKVLGIMALVMRVDGLNDADKLALDGFALAFGIPPERVVAIATSRRAA